MKKYILIIAALINLSLHAQDTKLTLEVIPGKLANQLTEEQMSTITELTLTGEMYNCDFYTIRNKMKKLSSLDISQVAADTIPEEGFAYATFSKIVLPKTLTTIEDRAFVNSDLQKVIWSAYPANIGDNIFVGCNWLSSFLVTEDNKDCASKDGILFSADFKELRLFPLSIDIHGYYTVPEGVEVIKQKAFMDTKVYEVTLPESLKRIEDKSFGVKERTPTSRVYGSFISTIICLSQIPPICEGDPFFINWTYPYTPELIVSVDSEELYQAAPYWKEFYRYVSVSSLPESNVWIEENILHIQNKEGINQIELIDMNGNILRSHRGNESCIDYKFQDDMRGCFLLKIYYRNGKVELHKLLN